uniref:Lipoprotein n=1 Tax=Gorilla gorilla gorilla TaxID=9595 RepID=A0A2I2ZJJ6_GORGO
MLFLQTFWGISLFSCFTLSFKKQSNDISSFTTFSFPVKTVYRYHFPIILFTYDTVLSGCIDFHFHNRISRFPKLEYLKKILNN